MRLFVILCFLTFFGIFQIQATHNRAGEITYEQIGELTIRMTITTYTKTSSIPADRDTLEVHWGDGTSQLVPRANGNGFPLPNDVKLNYYIAEHTYPGRATYLISMMDPNRNGGILNVNPPNSDSVPFYLETSFTFLNSAFQGYNSSAILLQPPLDFACVGKRFIHNPNAYDVDGDSLSYELIIPQQDSGLLVPNYSFPDQIGPGPDNQISLDPVTGDLVWLAPQVAGEYNIAMRIYEYRNGVLINSMIRDMQILVFLCENDPPEIATADEYCIQAGETLVVDINVFDPDVEQLVALSALGGPFEVDNPAFLVTENGFQEQPFSAQLIWETTCDHISEQAYNIVFRAVDNFFDTTGLAALKSIRVKVVGPPPQDVQASSIDESIRVTWASPYACELTQDDYFKGFSVWKRQGSNQFMPDSCTTGLEGQGYTRIGLNIKALEAGRYFFVDEDVQSGKTYCYRVLAEFALTSPGGFPFNRVESIPSHEVCLQLNRDIPLITNVSVRETDTGNGQIELRWVNPMASALDTFENPGPYRLRILKSPGIDGTDFSAVPGGEISSPTFAGLTDTSFLESGLNTQDLGYRYMIEFFTAGNIVPYGTAPEASSVFLNIQPTDNTNILTWEYQTPWDNYAFEIYRQNNQGVFELIGTTQEESYRDEGLENGIAYCYYITALGSYGIDDIREPLLNHSQEVCAVPVDDVPPCPPLITVRNLCEEATNTTPEEDFKNTVTWMMPGPDICPVQEEISAYNIYFTPQEGGDLALIATVDFGGINQYEHKPESGIAGCYAVTQIDLMGNESAFSEIICVENCPFYELPNAFTPNGDGQNEIFRPFPYRFIERVEFKVFNRWGQLVFETTNPDLNWDGKNLSGTAVSDGVYHYVCKVFERRNPAESVSEPIYLKGFIELIKGTN